MIHLCLSFPTCPKNSAFWRMNTNARPSMSRSKSGLLARDFSHRPKQQTCIRIFLEIYTCQSLVNLVSTDSVERTNTRAYNCTSSDCFQVTGKILDPFLSPVASDFSDSMTEREMLLASRPERTGFTLTCGMGLRDQGAFHLYIYMNNLSHVLITYISLEWESR